MKSWLAIPLLVCVFGTTTRADVVIDQENVGSCCFAYTLDYPEDYNVQTFTARNSGQLVGVAVRVSLSGYPGYERVSDDLYVSLMRTDSQGLPAIDQVLATQTISRYDVVYDLYAPMTQVDFSDANLRVQAGDVLAIALSSNHTYYPRRSGVFQYMWHLNDFDPHPGGEFYVYSPQIYGPTPFSSFYIPDPEVTRDAGFRVLIDVVPEPSSISMLGILGLALSLQRGPRRSERSRHG